MSKKLKDYLHLYLGCDFIGKFKGWTKRSEIMILCPDDLVSGKFEEIKPVLRKLSSIEYDEFIEATKLHIQCGGKVSISIEDFKTDTNSGIDKTYPEVFRYLLSKGFDLFNLIDDGLAIDKETLNQ